MEFAPTLQQSLLQKRYKRFFADIEVGGQVVAAHVPNTGSLKGCLVTPTRCLYSTNEDPKRKLRFTVQMVESNGAWVGVNTHLANELVWEAWQKHRILHLNDYEGGQREVKINKASRIDLVLWRTHKGLTAAQKISAADFSRGRFRFIEVKNVTMATQNVAMFPDAVTERGQKHLRELMKLVSEGHEAEILFVVQRGDCRTFSPADEIDPVYGKLLREAVLAGVRVSAFGCDLTEKGICLKTNPLPVDL